MFLPDLCLKHTIRELIIILISDFIRKGYEIPHELVALVVNFQGEEENWKSMLDNIISYINQLYRNHLNRFPENPGLTLQNHMILSIINALIYKLLNRGKLVISAINSESLRSAIEPALYIVGGKYAHNLESTSIRGPLNDYQLGVYTIIDLLTVKSMAIQGVRTCGFKESFFPCRYVSNGWGCPLVGLTPEEKEKRRKDGLSDDWCHYTRIMNILAREKSPN